MTDDFGRYRVLSEIGRGGMGIVYQAEDTASGKVVAIKQLVFGNIDPSKEREFKDRFKREAATAQRLKHPNIVSVLDVSTTGDNYFYVMELLDGHSLRTELELRGGKMKPRQFWSVLAQVAEGLSFAHSMNVVHRDVKPDNIFLLNDGRVKLTDFGIARAAEYEQTHLTKTGVMMGTLAYVSPEQLQDAKNVDHRADIFSLGVVTYESLSGQVPFTGDGIAQTIVKIVSQEERPLHILQPHITVELSSTVTKALRKRAKERYRSVKDFAREFESALATLPGSEQEEAFAISSPDAFAEPDLEQRKNLDSSRHQDQDQDQHQDRNKARGQLAAKAGTAFGSDLSTEAAQSGKGGQATEADDTSENLAEARGEPQAIMQMVTEPGGFMGVQAEQLNDLRARMTEALSLRNLDDGQAGAAPGAGSAFAGAPETPAQPSDSKASPGSQQPQFLQAGFALRGDSSHSQEHPTDHVKPVKIIDGFGKEKSRITEPCAICYRSGRLVVADNATRKVHMFSLDGRWVGDLSYKSDSTDTKTRGGSLTKPSGIAIDVKGRIYVCDSSDPYVRVFDSRGLFIKELCNIQGKDGGIQSIALDSTGLLYLSDIVNGAVQVFQSDLGLWMRTIGHKGPKENQFQLPAGLAIDRLNQIYCADYGHSKIFVFNKAGAFIRSFGGKGTAPGLFNVPRAVAVDNNDKIYVLDSLNHRVQVFGPTGEFFYAFGGRGDEPGRFISPSDLSLDAENDLLYVADKGNQRLQVFELMLRR